MKRLSMPFILTLIATTACLAETAHVYKGNVELPSSFFRSDLDCGLDLEIIQKQVKEERSKGQGTSFSNDILLFAGIKGKLVEANEAIKKDPKSKETQMAIIRSLSGMQSDYTKKFVDAGMLPEQVAKIPPLSRGQTENFKCNKVRTHEDLKAMEANENTQKTAQ